MAVFRHLILSESEASVSASVVLIHTRSEDSSDSDFDSDSDSVASVATVNQALEFFKIVFQQISCAQSRADFSTLHAEEGIVHCLRIL